MAFETPRWLEMLKLLGSEVIPRCAVPGFFLIAGVLLFRKPFTWKDNMKKKCRSLAVPYLLLNTLWIMFYILCQSIPATAAFFSKERILDWGPGADGPGRFNTVSAAQDPVFDPDHRGHLLFHPGCLRCAMGSAFGQRQEKVAPGHGLLGAGVGNGPDEKTAAAKAVRSCGRGLLAGLRHRL